MGLGLEHVDLVVSVANDAQLGSTFQERMDALAESLLGLVPGCSLSLIVLDPRCAGGEVDAFLRDNDERGAYDYANHYVGHDPLPEALLSRKEPLRLSDYRHGSAWGRDAYTGEFLPRYRIRYPLGAAAHPPPDGRVVQAAIHRSDSARDFADDEVRLLGLTVADLGKGRIWRPGASECLARARDARDVEARLGILVVSPSGDVEHADGGALRDPAALYGVEFPMDALLGESRRARELGQEQWLATPVGEDVLIVRSQPLEAGAAGRVMVVVEVRSLAERVDLATRFRLTPRERDVARQAARG
ncbi:MAG: hypothetical protein R3F62_27060 [Planctomycetota bacterium]